MARRFARLRSALNCHRLVDVKFFQVCSVNQRVFEFFSSCAVSSAIKIFDYFASLNTLNFYTYIFHIIFIHRNHPKFNKVMKLTEFKPPFFTTNVQPQFITALHLVVTLKHIFEFLVCAYNFTAHNRLNYHTFIALIFTLKK